MKFVAAMAGAAIAIAGAASAVPVTPQEVRDVLSANGATELNIIPTENSTSSQVSGKIDGVNFVADVRVCGDDRKDCKAVLLFANFSLDRDALPEDYVHMNDYNDRRTWGRAYVLPDQIGVDYAVDLYDENAFGRNEVETWQVILSSFREHNSVPEDKSKAKE